MTVTIAPLAGRVATARALSAAGAAVVVAQQWLQSTHLDKLYGYLPGMAEALDLQSWAEILRHLLALRHPGDGVRVVNGGLSAHATAMVLRRWPAVLARCPDWVICLLGGNDVTRTGPVPTKPQVSLAESIANPGRAAADSGRSLPGAWPRCWPDRPLRDQTRAWVACRATSTASQGPLWRVSAGTGGAAGRYPVGDGRPRGRAAGCWRLGGRVP